jgi:ligand-binding SRPBCC domain-containing protein
VQILPISLENAWDFFSNPANLKEITPAYMGFQVTSDPEFSQRPTYAGNHYLHGETSAWHTTLLDD